VLDNRTNIHYTVSVQRRRRKKEVRTMTITPINPLPPIRIPAPMPVMPNELLPLPGPVPAGNGGIVPPWLEGIDFGDDPGWGLELWDPTNPIVPTDPDTPVIM